MKNTQQHIEQLEDLLAQTQKAKILWEEMQIALKQAFDLQDIIMHDLEEAETSETHVDTLAHIFDAREQVWDIMGQIATRALEVKESRLQRAETGTEHHCCCDGHGHKKEGCCGHHHSNEYHDCCGHGENHCGCDAHAQEAPKKKCCKKKGA